MFGADTFKSVRLSLFASGPSTLNQIISSAYGFPDNFPVNTIHIMRLLRVVEDEKPSALKPLTEIFYVSLLVTSTFFYTFSSTLPHIGPDVGT